jgi:hypothetical protein
VTEKHNAPDCPADSRFGAGGIAPHAIAPDWLDIPLLTPAEKANARHVAGEVWVGVLGVMFLGFLVMAIEFCAWLSQSCQF